MGTVETQSKAPYGVSSSALEENAEVQGSEEQEKNELGEEALGTVRSGEGHCSVPENGAGFSSVGGGDGVVEVVESPSVFETKVRENDCQVLADSEMNGVSSLLKMRESGRSAVASREGSEKLDCVVLSDGGLVGVDGEARKAGKENEEGKKDEDCDGKIVTVEVPIVETSENMDVEVEDLSDQRYGFSVGDFVWGKIKCHPWWPGRLYDPSDASDFALKLKQKNRLLVAYFGDGTFAWCHPSQLKPFEDNFDDMVRQSNSRSFTNAVQEAVNEVGRLLDMKMSRSVVVRGTASKFTPLLAKNSGINEGVLVPESGIERLSAVPVEPAELLSQVKRIAGIIDIASILELEILKAQLSAFYLSRGGYKLPDYEDPRPVPGLEDSLTDDAVDVGDGNVAVEAPSQGPFEDDYSTLPLSPRSNELCHSPRISGSRSNRRRKQKSIAQILGEDKDKDIHTKNREGDATDEVVVDAIGSSSRKKRKGSEDAVASKPGQKRKVLLLNTDSDRNVQSAENEGSGGKGNSDKVTSLRSNKKKEAFGNENNISSSGSKKETTDEGKTKQQNEKGSLSRERKKSKYLSPPFTTSIRGLMKGNIETESLKVPSEVLKCDSEAFEENSSKEVATERELSDSSNHKKQDDEKNTIIDPEKIQVSSGEVLSKVRDAAITPQIPRESTSLDKFVDFMFVMRSSLYREGSLYSAYKKRQSGRKRKKPETELGVLGKDQNQPDHISPNLEKKETTPSMPKGKKGKNGTEEKASTAVLFVSFFPGSSLPSKSDLITMFSKFGALNEAETDMFRTNYTARVSFRRARDAEKALKHSQKTNPFESAEVTFQLQYPSGGSKSGGEHTERSKRSKLSPPDNKKKAKTLPTTPSVSLSQCSDEASKLNFIKQKLQGMNLMLESSDGKSPDLKTKLEKEVKGLLEDVNKMVESTQS